MAELERADLRGMGGGGFPAARKRTGRLVMLQRNMTLPGE